MEKNSFEDPKENIIYVELHAHNVKEKGRIELHICKPKDSAENVGIADVGKVFIGVQDAVYHLGEYKFSQGNYRACGQRNKTIQKRTKLYPGNLKAGSVIAEAYGDPQQAIYGASLVEECIDSFGNICHILNDTEEDEIKSKIEKEIENPNSRKRVMLDFANFWPGGDNKYRLSLQTPKFVKKKLNDLRKPTIMSLTKIDTEKNIENVFGLFNKPDYTKDEFVLTGPFGNIKGEFKKEHEKYVGKVVKLTGECDINSVGEIKNIKNIKEINTLHDTMYSRIITADGEIKLKNPVNANITFEEKNWILENDILGIVAYSDKYEDALEKFQEDFYFLYQEYYMEDPKNMIENALKIKEYLKKLIDGGNK